jgi:hypothetical protein
VENKRNMRVGAKIGEGEKPRLYKEGTLTHHNTRYWNRRREGEEPANPDLVENKRNKRGWGKIGGEEKRFLLHEFSHLTDE